MEEKVKCGLPKDKEALLKRFEPKNLQIVFLKLILLIRKQGPSNTLTQPLMNPSLAN
jgi:hypothetical protein